MKLIIARARQTAGLQGHLWHIACSSALGRSLGKTTAEAVRGQRETLGMNTLGLQQVTYSNPPGGERYSPTYSY